jgi:Protein of unknown function (DUF3485)
LGFALLVVTLWVFPRFWYTRSSAQIGHYWLTEQTNVAAWGYREVPVSKAAEAVLVADRLVNGEYESTNGEVVRVFLAKRYSESENEIGLFAHTPDRCWTETGWTLHPAEPQFKVVNVHGIPVGCERRVFSSGPNRELVYFAGLVGGQPLPYRLDHNLAVGLKHGVRLTADQTGTALRAVDSLFWRRIWDSFASRRPLIGPKQFIRISTPVAEGGIGQADGLLEDFLPRWLQLVAYEKEIKEWRAKALAP